MSDIQSQWKIWRRCLKRLGMRYHEPYQTRHTFAPLALMAGANPTWIARQMGHANAQMLFNVYGKWIDAADKSRERDKLSLAFSPEFRHGFRYAMLAPSAPHLPSPRGGSTYVLRGKNLASQ